MPLAMYCPLPPTPTPGGTSIVHSDGYMFGRVCSAGAGFVPINGTAGCNSARVSQTSSSVSGSDLVTVYSIAVEKSNPVGGTLVMRLTFTQPVDPSNVTFGGAVRPNSSLKKPDMSFVPYRPR